jgi:cytochrome c oxidase subunit II
MAWIRHRLSRLVALIGAAFALAGCALIEIDNAALTTFDPAGPNARRLDDLFWLVFWIAAAVFAVVMAGLVVILVFFRDRGQDGAKEPKQLHGNAKLEVLWTVIPALILAAIAVPTVSAVFELTGCDDDSMRVEVIGHQWWFEFHYPDHGIDTANILVMPVDEEVCLEMTSDDVLHNFWVPSIHGKRYLVPGQTTLLRMEADRIGTFQGHCAEFCGLSHSLMRTLVEVVSRADFEAWAAAQLEPAVVPEEGSLAYEGFEIYRQRCIQCHAMRFDQEEQTVVIPREAFNGPDLTHFASRSKFAGAVLPEQGESRLDALRRWLADPPYVKPGSFMPDLALSASEIDSLVAFLEGNE